MYVRNRYGYKTLTKSRLKRTSNGAATYTQDGVLSVSPVCCAVTPCSDTCVLSVQVESEAHWRQLLEEEYAMVLTERRVYEGATATSRLGDDCASARL